MRTYFNFLIALVVLSQGSLGTTILSRSDTAPVAEISSVAAVENALDVHIALTTPTSTTITFKPETQLTGKGADSATQTIPHLVLKRNGVLTPGFERTLLVAVENLPVEEGGLYVALTIETEHVAPDLAAEDKKIEVWHEVKAIPHAVEQSRSIQFSVTFNQFLADGENKIQTPTDYFGYTVSIINAQGQVLQEIRQDFAFLMENQWKVPLPQVLETAPGAAPRQLLLYYCDMFPFQRDMQDAQTRLVRDEIERYVQVELVPSMVHAFQIQTDVWNLPWYPEWTNSQPGEDPKTLSVALGAYKIWYHGNFLYLGTSRISIRVDGVFGDYTNLTEGIMSVFHHELFHNQQRNINLHFHGNGNLAGKDDAWKMFSEGTAVLASAVGQPGVELGGARGIRSYLQRVKAFVGEDGLIGGGLNKSYTEIPYHTAVYWRFLYEHCGGLVDGKENPTAGMQIIRHILEILYRGDVVEIRSSSDVTGALPKVIDLALQGTPSCEFRTYKESLLQFSEAVYALRMQNGRCTVAIEVRGCGFFDPYNLYPAPNAETYALSAQPDSTIAGAIPSSYGIDLMELSLDTALNHKSLRLLLETESGGQDELCMEVWQIQTVDGSLGGSKSIRVGEPQSVCTQDGSALLAMQPASSEPTDAIGVVITRLDAHEGIDAGEYALRISGE